ncbi:hypothetical protein [Jidongwangia harbinensis]|uniref:hypothetical protein n=1 Tax=Jidongwangia harbinensis TaxID=2878561 RepID=UPI001CD9B1BC|nr:hypothetical protein [Jidongwangia harbinensis]MCA2214131.1 hypothetical protein [Jidongwangia harbinensis]
MDAQHTVKEPLTVVRVFDEAGADGTRELSRDDVLWVRTTLLDRIATGEVPLRAVPITEKQALRIRERWERRISYRYSVVVDADDPTEETLGVVREWDASAGNAVHEERYVGYQVQQWLPSNKRWESEYGRGDTTPRLIPTDAATVHQYISALKGW